MESTGAIAIIVATSFFLILAVLALLFIKEGKKQPGKKQQNIEQKNSFDLTSTQITLLKIGIGFIMFIFGLAFIGWFYASALGGGFGGGGM